MFEIKYDRDGKVIKNPEMEATKDIDTQAPATEQAITESLEALESDAAEQSQEKPEEVAPQPTPSRKPTPDESWAQLRKQKERAEEERDEALRILRALDEQSRNQSASAKVMAGQVREDEQSEFNLPDDDIVEARHVKKVVQELKKVKQEFNEYKRQATEMTIEATLRAKFPDFDKIVTVDNLKALRESDPEEAALIHQSSDNYLKAAAAYKAIKRVVVQPEPQELPVEKTMAQKNAVKPKPTATISPQQGETPLTKANAFAQGLTKELQAQLRKEMEEARRHY